MKTAVVFIADGSEEIETLTPVDYLRRAGVEVTIVAISSSRTVTMSRGVSVNADITLESYLSSVSNGLPDAVVVPGGMPGTKNIAASRSALTFIETMLKDGRLVCSICAAPAYVLSKTGALDRRKWTCYPGCEDQALDYKSQLVTDKPFVHDGNVITGRGAGTAEEFAMEIVKTLCGEEICMKVKTDTLQR